MTFEAETGMFIQTCDRLFGKKVAKMVEERIEFYELLAKDVRVAGVEIYKTFAIITLKSGLWEIQIDASDSKVFTSLPNYYGQCIGDWIE